MKRPPNVLLLMSDQHRADLMSCVGNSLVPTPGIDKIASAGMLLENTYCPYPLCVASRMSFLTSLYAHNSGAIDNNDRLNWGFRTIAHHFSDNGYLTGLIGKMHFNDAHKRGFEYHLSVNDWLMYLGPKVRHYANQVANHDWMFHKGPDNYHEKSSVFDTGCSFPDLPDLWKNNNPWIEDVTRWPVNQINSPLAAEDQLDSFITRETINFLKQNKSQPFFLVASFMMPHCPLYPPKKWADRFPIDSEVLPEIGDISKYPEHIKERINRHKSHGKPANLFHRAGYNRCLSFVDHLIGTIYDCLSELGLKDDTIVVYTSDHGEMDGDHGIFQKFCMFEPAIKVPLIISFPGRLPMGLTNEGLTEYIGLYPTLAELAGIPEPKEVYLPGAKPEAPYLASNFDGVSFVEQLLNPTAKGADAIFSEYSLKNLPNQYAVREMRYKYVHNHGSTHELYDLKKDPYEMENQINRHDLSETISRLKERLYNWYNPENNIYLS